MENINPIEFGVTPSLFLEWRSPRFGQSNPTRLDNKVWEWLIRTKVSAYQAAQLMNSPSSCDKGPTWCFERFGQSVTELPDGRVVYIGGEHEDHYDPDFNIYNDGVVIGADNSIEIYGYPKTCFPPTDFHTATLVDSQIVLIGSLGYPEERRELETQVYRLDIDSYEVSKVNTCGESPGWIHDHRAELESDGKSITIRKGKLDVGAEHSLIENIDDWTLRLSDFSWERIIARQWVRWEVKRSDRKHNHLWEIRQALWSFEVNWKDDYEKAIRKLSVELGITPDIKLVKDVYKPQIPHQPLPEVEDECRVYRLTIDNVTVRYVEESYCVQITVEGNLPADTIEILKKDVLKKLSLLENTECDIEII